jgi:glycosyltransferase involved in cell wall biosynthesis
LSSPSLRKKPSVTIIIPALNEAKALPLVLQEIPNEIVDKVIVVDNGSTDNTVNVAHENGATVIIEPVRGYGRAVLAGLAQVDSFCDIVVILDGDHSDFPEDLSMLLTPIINGKADMVIGSRVHAALPGALMPQQRFGNWLTCVLIDLLYGVRFSDMGPFRAIRLSLRWKIKTSVGMSRCRSRHFSRGFRLSRFLSDIVRASASQKFQEPS